MTTYTTTKRPMHLPRYERNVATLFVKGSPTPYAPYSIGQGKLVVADAFQTVKANNPDYKTQIVRQVNAGTNFYRSEAFFLPRFSTVKTSYELDATTRVEESVTSTFVWDPLLYIDKTDDLALIDLALKRLKSKIGDHRAQVQVLAPTAEVKELRDSFKFLTTSALDLARSLLEARKTHGRSVLKFASEAWLQWSFALSPTFNDIKSIAAVIDEILKEPKPQMYQESGKAKKAWMSYTRQNYAAKFGNGNVTARCHHKLSYKFDAGFKFLTQSSNNYSYAASFGLDPVSVIPAVYALTPWTWLLDYFTTMGEYLEDQYVARLYDTTYCSLSKRYTCDIIYNVDPVRKSGYVRSSYVTGSPTECRFIDIRRTMYSSVPGRILRFKSLDEIGSNGAKKLSNLVAILASDLEYFRKPFRPRLSRFNLSRM